MSAEALGSRLGGLLRRRWGILVLGGALALFLAPGLARLETDNSPRVFFSQGSPGIDRYDAFRRDFGSDKVVRIVVEGSDLWTPEGLDELRRLETGAAELQGVEEAIGLWARHARGGTGGGRRGGKKVAGVGWPPENIEAFRRRIGANPLDLALGLLSRDGEVATVLVTLVAASNAETVAVLARLDEICKGSSAVNDLRVRTAGSPVLNRALDRSSEEIGRRYFPLLVALAVVLLALVFRRPAAVAIPLAFVGVVELIPLGAMGYLGVDLNLVLAVLSPLLFVIALATAVHLLVGVRDLEFEGAPRREAVIATYRDKGWAVFWTGLSTLIGFASLATGRVAPVRTLGIWAALAIGAMTVLAFSLYPALLTLGRVEAMGRPRGGRAFENFFRVRGRRWAAWSVRRRSLVLLIAALLTVLALAGVPRLRVVTNALTFLPPDDPVRSDIEDLEKKGIGSMAVELVLSGGEDPAAPGEAGVSFRSLASFEALAALGGELRSEPAVLAAVSAGDLLDDAVRRAPGGAFFGRSTAKRVAFDRLLEEEVLGRYVTTDGRRARVTILTPTVGAGELIPLLERIETRARSAFPGAGVVTTGEYPLVIQSQAELLRTLGLSLTLTVLAIAIIFRVLLKSWRLTGLAMLPNLWPVAGVLGIMGWSATPLDVATVMVASVVLGLAVDDTIHTLGHFRELAPREGCFEGVVGTLERTAAPYVLTGIILAAGFGVCALSSFAPTARFGMLSAVAIVLAVLGDLFLLPALLACTPDEVVGRLGKRRV